MWSEGLIVCPATGAKFRFWVKHYEEGSEFGISGGKISKMSLRRLGGNKDVLSYDRGWDIPPTDETAVVYEILLRSYN